jgi:phage protein D
MPSTPEIARGPKWQITYKGGDITKDIAGQVLKITYTSHIHGAAPNLELQVEDKDKRWQSSSYPAVGDVISLAIGYSDAPLYPCPAFQIDEIKLDGPPDTFTMMGLATFITPAMREHNNGAYTNQTLLDIANTIAAKYGLKVYGIPNNLNPNFGYLRQKQETDLGFLKRLAEEYNYNFTIRDGMLIFTWRADLENQPATVTVTRPDVEKFSFKHKTRGIYKSCELSYFDPVGKTNITVEVPATEPGAETNTSVLKLSGERVENALQAQLKATAQLHLMNMLAQTGSFSGPGKPAYVGGNNLQLTGWGVFDGKWMMEEVQHELIRLHGYTSHVKMRRVD